MFERFREEARRVTVLAHEEAKRFFTGQIEIEHAVVGMLDDDSACRDPEERQPEARRILNGSLGITLEQGRALLEERLTRAGEYEPDSGSIPFSPPLKQVYELALREALSLGHNYISSQHLLLGIIRQSWRQPSQTFLCDLTRKDQEQLRALIIMSFDTDVSRPSPAPQQIASPPFAYTEVAFADKLDAQDMYRFGFWWGQLVGAASAIGGASTLKQHAIERLMHSWSKTGRVTYAEASEAYTELDHMLGKDTPVDHPAILVLDALSIHIQAVTAS